MINNAFVEIKAIKIVRIYNHGIGCGCFAGDSYSVRFRGNHYLHAYVAEGNSKWRSFMVGRLSGVVEPVGVLAVLLPFSLDNASMLSIR
jgi:hypothetical protein